LWDSELLVRHEGKDCVSFADGVGGASVEVFNDVESGSMSWFSRSADRWDFSVTEAAEGFESVSAGDENVAVRTSLESDRVDKSEGVD
jgi:hypothetical protein